MRRRVFVLLGLCATLVLGCGDSPLKSRYFAERDFWTAGKLERRFNIRQGKDDALAREVEQAYRKILRDYPLSAAEGDISASTSFIRMRGAAAAALARVYLQDGNANQAVRALMDARGEARGDLQTGIQVYNDLIGLLARTQKGDSLPMILEETTEKLPAVTPDGQPIPLVLEAPLRLADLRARSDRATEVGPALDRAYSYYDDQIRAHGGSSLQVAAMVQQANVRLRQNRPREAEELLRSARSLPQAGQFDASILYSLATVREQGLKDPLGAVNLYRELVRIHPDDPSAPQARLRIAISFAEAGKPDSAEVAFTSAEETYAKDANMAAQTRFLSAKALMAANRGAEALRRFRSVSTDFPRSEAGLQAPLEIADYYRRSGDKNAEKASLREAESEYERIIQDLASERTLEALIMAAMDHLASAKARLEDWTGTVEVLVRRSDAFPADAGSPLSLVQAAGIKDGKLSDRKGSIELLQKMVDRYPRHPLAQKVRDKIVSMGGGS